MNESKNKSEVARLKQQIALEYEAAQNGLSGLSSGSAQHDFITTKTENLGAIHERLIELVGHGEAIQIIVETIWSPADRYGSGESATQ